MPKIGENKGILRIERFSDLPRQEVFQISIFRRFNGAYLKTESLRILLEMVQEHRLPNSA